MAEQLQPCQEFASPLPSTLYPFPEGEADLWPKRHFFHNYYMQNSG